MAALSIIDVSGRSTIALSIFFQSFSKCGPLAPELQNTGHEASRIDMKRLGDFWCVYMHNSPMWPIHGQYECLTCGRRQPVPWAQPTKFSLPNDVHRREG